MLRAIRSRSRRLGPSSSPGNALLFYTDGLVERRNEALDRSLDRLRDALLTAGSVETADALCEAAIRVSLADTRREDDVCVLALRRTTADDG